METEKRGQAESLDGIKVVTGVIGDDVHVVGISLVEHALRAAGAEVVSLGVLTPLAEFVQVSVKNHPLAVFMSSSNGHAAISCATVKPAFREAGLDDVILYLGGTLTVGRPDEWDAIEKRFLGLGFDRVFPPRSDPMIAIEQLSKDIQARKLENQDI